MVVRFRVPRWCAKKRISNSDAECLSELRSDCSNSILCATAFIDIRFYCSQLKILRSTPSSSLNCSSHTATIVKPKQADTCGLSIRNEYTSKSLICTNIKYYRTYSINLLSRLYEILLSITKKTARKWKFGIVDDASCSAHKCQLVLVLL